MKKGNNKFIKANKMLNLKMPEFDLLNNGKVDLYKNAIKVAVETYPLEWKVILETLQNSIDAIHKNDKIKEGNIDILFNLNDKSITIKDNGVGFPLNEDLFFLHGGTKANERKTKGKIGVGLKVTIFSSEDFYINSIFKKEGQNFSWSAKIKNANSYFDKSSLSAFTTSVQKTKSNTGTIITYSFKDDSILDFIKGASSKINEIPNFIEMSFSEKFIKAIEYFFRTNGYAADTYNLIGNSSEKKIKINIKIQYDKIPTGLSEELGIVFEESNGLIEFSFYDKFWDMQELIEKQRGMNRLKVINHKFYEKGIEFGKFDPDNFIWIRSYKDKDEIRELLPNKLKDKYEELLKKINGIYLALGTTKNMKKFYFKSPDTFISINGIPSDHSLPNPTSNTAYANLVLCIIDVDSTLNYGKLQTTNRYLVSQCGKFYLDIYRNAIVRIGERTVGVDVEEDTSSKLVEKPTTITNLKDLNLDCSFKKVPTDENALIAIFFDLMGRGIIKDYDFYSLHAKQKYDARAMMKTKNMPPIQKPNNDSDLKFVEFKLKLSQLIDEIAERNKELKKMTLMVVWEDDASKSKNKPEDYEIIDLEDSKDKNSGFYGVTKCLVNKLDGTERQIFIMKDFIESLKE